jgi:cell division protein FtsZ
MARNEKVRDLEKEIILNKQIPVYETIIRVIGTGGAGNNTITRLKNGDSKHFELIAVNTDAQDLRATNADRKILIGRAMTGGLGAGGDPEIGERSAEESKSILRSAIEGSSVLFVTCGLGGGTGTGSAPFICGLARSMGILTVAIVTMPFSIEGIIRWENAQIGLEKLRKKADTLILLKNDRLLEIYPELHLHAAFRAGDDILINALTGLSNLIKVKGLINLDFADISAVLRDGPNAVIGIGESNSENRVEEAVFRTVNHPMMKTDIAGAQSILIHIWGGTSLTLKEAHKIIQIATQKLDTSARIIWGATIDENLGQTLRVMLIVSGLQDKETQKDETEIYDKSYKPETTQSEKNVLSEKQLSLNTDKTIFDIKESIIAQGSEVSTKVTSVKPITQTTMVFYKIFEEEAIGDLRRFDRSLHFMRENLENRRALLDAKQSCKLIHASAQMFGFDEVAILLAAIEKILTCVQSREIQLNEKIIDSVTLAMEMVVDLIENRSDGTGETGYIVDRLNELMEEQMESFNPNSDLTEF